MTPPRTNFVEDDEQIEKSSGALGIVVVNYASAELLRRHLPPLQGGRHRIDIVVVDSYSSDAETNRVARLAADHSWAFVPLADNRGFGPAVDAGVAVAVSQGCTHILLLNPDAVATPEAVGALRQHCLEFPDAMVSPRIETSTGSVYSRGSGLQSWDGRVVRLPESQRRSGTLMASDVPGSRGGGRWVEPWLTAACLAMPAAVFRRAGGMGDAYFMYWEDVELSHRAARAGAQLMVRDDIVVIHDEGGTQDTRYRGKSGLYYFYNCRNRLVFGSRNCSRRQLLGWMLATPRASWHILVRGGRRQLVQTPGPAWQVLRGSATGMWIATGSLLGRRSRRLPTVQVVGSQASSPLEGS